MYESNYGQQVSIFGTNSDISTKLGANMVNEVCRFNVNAQCQKRERVNRILKVILG